MKNSKLTREIIEVIIIFLLVVLFTVTNVFGSVDYMLKDFVYQTPRGVNNKIKIIAIDERTLEELGPINTWSRQYYADLVNYLNADANVRPDVIGFDIIFSGYFGENEISEGDKAFVDACVGCNNVVLASQIAYEQKAETDATGLSYYPIKDVYNPYDELMQEVQVGFANVAQDSDGMVRRICLKESYNNCDIELFSKVIYDVYCKENNLKENETITDKYGKVLINYAGRPGDYEAFSFMDVLNGTIDNQVFKDSIVLVGAYATGMQDNFNVPNVYNQQMYGVEIHANIIQAFMENCFSVNANPIIVGVVFGIVAALLHLFFRRSKVWLATIWLVLVIGIDICLGRVLNDFGHTISLFYLPLALIISYIYCLALRYIEESLKRKKVLNAFKKYVAPEIVDEIAKKGDFSVKLGGENRDVAVLFVDIRGFTTMSEVLTPEEVVEILNHYLNLTTNAIFKNKGTLDKFVGDATMAVFNSPFDLPDYEFHAVCAAMDIVNGGKALEKELLEKYGRSVGFGVGVNCGPAVVGNIGCEFRMDFTAIGDTVNTAARLEANAQKGQILISQEVYDRVKNRVEVEEIGEIPLKGKSKGVFVYSVLDVKKD